MNSRSAKNSPPPIFIVGSERSGSNLLRSLLGNNSQVEAPVAPHFQDAWRGLLPFYGDLRISKNVRFLLEDMLEYANHPFNDWRLTLDMAAIIDMQRPMCFMDAFEILYRGKALSQGCSTYVCKDNHIFNHAFQVRLHFPDAKFLYLFRDPRDHCASWKAKPMHLKTVWDSILKWEREQQQCLDLINSHGFEMHFVSYEDLIADTPQVMSKMLEFCGLPVEEGCFETDPGKHRAAAERYVYWENLNKPIMRDNKRKYRRTLTQEEISLIETRAAKLMDVLGYPCETARDWIPPKGHRFRLPIERWLVERRHRQHFDQESKILRSKQMLLADIRSRAAQRKIR